MTSTTRTPKKLKPAAARQRGIRPTFQGTCEAADRLSDALRAAGLTMIAPTCSEDGEHGPYVELRKIDAHEAVELARLFRKAMHRSYKTARDLHEAVRAHGLDDFPTPAVPDAKIQLGDISLPTADRLARILGAPAQPEMEDFNDWPEAQQVADRLFHAFKKATRGGFMDVNFLPWCTRCGAEPMLALGDLTIKTARRFVRALQFGDP